MGVAEPGDSSLSLPGFAFLFNSVKKASNPCFAYEWIESGFPALSSLFVHYKLIKVLQTPTLVQMMYLSSCMNSDSTGIADRGTLVKVKD